MFVAVVLCFLLPVVFVSLSAWYLAHWMGLDEDFSFDAGVAVVGVLDFI